jgi:hypothetical protein
MSIWGDVEILIDLLDRQFALFHSLQGPDQVIRLPRLLSFLQGEHRIAALLADHRLEAEDAVRQYETADAAIRCEAARLWSQHGAALGERLATVEDEALHAYGRMQTFAKELEERPPADLDEDVVGAEKDTGRLLNGFHSWWKWASDMSGDTGLGEDLARVGSRVDDLRAKLGYETRRLRERRRGLAWPAYTRLMRDAAKSNPAPPEDDSLEAFAVYRMAMEFANSLAAHDARDRHTLRPAVKAFYESIQADARLVHAEVRIGLGLARSRRALVERFAARCEAFDAEGLRAACKADSSNAERTLTRHLARYLHDAGFTPLIDPTLGGLRPDVLDVQAGSAFYVEAKQYDDANPRSALTRAFRQVWGTWGRVRKQHLCNEAFLVVFRRGGPWAELPKEVRSEGLTLYSVVADISTEGGSRERRKPIRMTEDELRPQEGKDSTEGPRSPRTRGRQPTRRRRAP